MKTQYRKAIEKLETKGWDVRFQPTPKPIPEEILFRYGWLPSKLRVFMQELELVVSPDNKAWFNTSGDLSGTSGAAFAWNQWEQDSMAAAKGFPKIEQAVKEFWDQHFPMVMSVKASYAYFAIQKNDLVIVCGEEPEYEDATKVADSFEELLDRVSADDPQLVRWV